MSFEAEVLWPRYAGLWSADAGTRAAAMPEYLDGAVSYSDPNIALSGLAAFDDYMAGFQRAMPGCRFEIDRVLSHYGRSLAWWRLCDAGGKTLQHGVSTARHVADGRLAEIAGFFPVDR